MRRPILRRHESVRSSHEVRASAHVENREVGRPGQVDDRSEKLHVWLSQIETDAKALDAAATQKQLNVTSLVRAPKR